MRTLKNWTTVEQQPHQVTLVCEDGSRFHIFVLEETLFRVLLEPESGLQLPKTWSIAPVSDDSPCPVADTPLQGRPRNGSAALAGFSLPEFTVQDSGEQLIISTSRLRVTISRPLQLQWACCNEDNPVEWHTIAEDRPTGAYARSSRTGGVAHFMRCQQHVVDDQSHKIPGREYYFGLGEKAGETNRYGRRFEMRNLDAMGYDAERTDPLYKHIPFYITHLRRNTLTASYGLFYDNLSTCWFDLGNEIDNYHAPYRSYRAEAGDLDYYFILGPSVANVTEQFNRLTGGTHIPPKWSLGYSASSMYYTDAENTQTLLGEFLAQCDRHQIPCDSFQLSSGYTSIGNKRYVFHWNQQKVPDIQNLCRQFEEQGIKLIANIKPCLLQDHPEYRSLLQDRLFIETSEGVPERSVFWDDEGSHLDFTHPPSLNWWQNKVKTSLLENGIAATWNDNNEFEIWDDRAYCRGFGEAIDIRLMRPVLALLMMRASFSAQREFSNGERPFLISRSGCAGMGRYVQTWTGDNKTSWNSLKYNIKMGIGLSLSGVYNFGHDIGGFAGPRPDPELFVRWVQNGALHPRCTIHSWNSDGSVNEPWMYPEVLSEVREALHLRYHLLPFLGHLLWQAHHESRPIITPTLYHFEADPLTLTENDEFMVGDALLVASVVTANSTERQVYLPANQNTWDTTGGWYDF
ncbi:MAG: hypothetical protein MI864_27550, partial [Pseudomonadales bacterium]|nr:hypothetical protein [Pseudomonadales bacterium]